MTKPTKADYIALITKKLPGFKATKKHTIAVLEAMSKEARKSRMAPGIRKATGPVAIPGADSKRMVILKALNKGATVEGLQKTLNWTRPSVTGALLTDVRAIGFPYEVMADGVTLQLRPPKGVEI